MVLADVNVIISAHRPESEHHAECLRWLDATVDSDRAYGISELVLGSFVRIVTNPRAYKSPTPIVTALKAANALRMAAHAVAVTPGPRHWEIFERLCRDSDARGNVVTDAYLAALAIESGCEWITLDGDFARFHGLKWRRPF
jgi:toxin-antitoxin system PIN domain toxin